MYQSRIKKFELIYIKAIFVCSFESIALITVTCFVDTEFWEIGVLYQYRIMTISLSLVLEI